MMSTYFDTSALVKIYVAEAHSEKVRREAIRAGQIVCTPLHSLELHSAIRQLVGRGTLAAGALGQFEQHLDDDRRAHRVADVAVDLSGVFRRAERLVRSHTERRLCRTLDVLHVAAALEQGCRKFVSADDRQLALAKAAGLTVIDVKA